MEDDSNKVDNPRSALEIAGQYILVVVGGVILLWIAIAGVVAYVVTSDRAVVAVWETYSTAIVFAGLLLMINLRLALVSFRLGVMEKWQQAETSTWYAATRPYLIMECVGYLFLMTCLVIMITLLIATSTSQVVILIMIGVGLAALARGAYLLGGSTPLSLVSGVDLGHWYFPLTSRFHATIGLGLQIQTSVPQYRALIIRWKATTNGFWASERVLAVGVWTAPVIWLLLAAVMIRMVW